MKNSISIHIIGKRKCYISFNESKQWIFTKFENIVLRTRSKVIHNDNFLSFSKELTS